IDVTATSTSSIDAFTFAGSGSFAAGTSGPGFNFSGAGAGSRNKIDNTIDSIVSDSVLTPGGLAPVTVTASDASNVKADAGGVAALLNISNSAGAAVTLGAAAAVNDISNDTGAVVDPSTVTIGGDLLIEATSSSKIDALAFGIAAALTSNQGFGFQLTGAGSAVVNTIDGTTKAELDSSTVNAGANVHVSASDTSRIKADAGAVALAIGLGGAVNVNLGIAASVAVNDIGKISRAKISGSEVHADRVDVTALGRSLIEALSMAGTLGVGVSSGVGIGFAGAGAVSINSIHDTVEALITSSSDVHATAGPVLVSASETGNKLFTLG